MSDTVPSLYGGPATRRVRTRDLIAAKERGEKWAMLTSYDQYTAGLFDAAAFAGVLERVPGEVAKHVTHEVPVPTIGIGAGPETDAQVLVWQDMAGLRTGKAPRFVKRYADLHTVLTDAVRRYADEVRDG